MGKSIKSTSSRRNRNQRIGFAALSVISILTVVPILMIVIYIFVQGLPAISWEFLTGFPEDGMRGDCRSALSRRVRG